MVDVSHKALTAREATAYARVQMSAETVEVIAQGNHHKGDVFATARIAGIQAAKQTSTLIPLCHPLMLSKVSVDLKLSREQNCVEIFSLAKLSGQTGVEMEALTAASVAALTVFDMCKAVDPNMVVQDLKVLTKTGGKSGDWQHGESK